MSKKKSRYRKPIRPKRREKERKSSGGKWKLVDKVFWFVVVPIFVVVVGIVLADLYKPRLVGVVEKGTAITSKSKCDKAQMSAGERVRLCRTEVLVKNYGLRAGRIHRCYSVPYGLLPNPKVQITKIVQDDLCPFCSGMATIHFRIVETDAVMGEDLQLQFDCDNEDGSGVLSFYAIVDKPQSAAIP